MKYTLLYGRVNMRNFLQGTRITWPFLTGHPVHKDRQPRVYRQQGLEKRLHGHSRAKATL